MGNGGAAAAALSKKVTRGRKRVPKFRDELAAVESAIRLTLLLTRSRAPFFSYRSNLTPHAAGQARGTLTSFGQEDVCFF
ncbi:hypothetical protein MPTK1_8g08110 [Marchantia polymorpha subsp. ruderalis]|uniref:Uncharacterized protein n=1 Tax=Marchantia polymorpha TaxID=3197 RepID=A0A2R6W4H5_MARPO|nr:hypothetical protein MARPO_0155s0007 [Marchantia polymorpha]BBN19128.1 hypothetical protein Mp_8g08110 [Marchantia polymorpha subsp. ruderalis]|eukprot:PTQ28743.1 hypothetical protein MARPO_0155s0007 [Marchantia polymorpha]